MSAGMPMLRLLAGALLLVLAACGGSPPTQFYTLSGMQLPPGNPNTRGTVVGVGPVTLPEYLDRPQIVTRTSGNRVTLANYEGMIHGFFLMGGAVDAARRAAAQSAQALREAFAAAVGT